MTARFAAPALLYWLRHAPVLAPPGQCYGRLDVPADADATARAAQAAAARCPPGMAMWVSPLGRCQQLARALSALRPDMPCHTDARLAEMDFGRWEGRLWDDIGAAALDGWLADFVDCPAGGGESVRAFMQRVGAAWDAWHARGQPAVWITHAGVMRAALLLAQGVRVPASAADWPADALPFGQCLRLRADGADGRSVAFADVPQGGGA